MHKFALAACAAVALALWPSLACAADPFGSLTIEQVEQRIQDKQGKNVYLYDNNSLDTYKNGHVPGARWVDYKKISAADLPADKDATLIFYCASEH